MFWRRPGRLCGDNPLNRLFDVCGHCRSPAEAAPESPRSRCRAASSVAADCLRATRSQPHRRRGPDECRIPAVLHRPERLPLRGQRSSSRSRQPVREARRARGPGPLEPAPPGVPAPLPAAGLPPLLRLPDAGLRPQLRPPAAAFQLRPLRRLPVSARPPLRLRRQPSYQRLPYVRRAAWWNSLHPAKRAIRCHFRCRHRLQSGTWAWPTVLRW